jgi:hypothetical protein
MLLCVRGRWTGGAVRAGPLGAEPTGGGAELADFVDRSHLWRHLLVVSGFLGELCGLRQFCASRRTRYARHLFVAKRILILLLVALTLAVAGCGGGGGKKSSGGTGTIDTSKVNGISIGNCLNTQDFLVQPSQTELDGQSPAGVVFTMKLYPTIAAAQAAAKGKNPKTTAVVENGVVDFKGNPSPYAGAPPAKISKTELDAIRTCIDKAGS